HLDRAGQTAADLVELGRAVVTERRTRSASENRSHERSFTSEVRPPSGEDARPDRVQSLPYPDVDFARCEAEAHELLPRDDPMLRLRELPSPPLCTLRRHDVQSAQT